MTTFILYLFCSLGISYAWSDTDVSRPLRNLVARIPYISTPLLCHECCSFWISLLLSIWLDPLQDIVQPIASNILSAFCGFFINMFFVRKNIIPYK